MNVTKHPSPPTGLQALEQSDALPEDITPELKKVLQGSAFRTHCDVCNRFSEEADCQKNRLLRELTGANVSLIIAGVLSGLVLASGAMRELLGSLWTDRIVLTFGFVALVMGALAAMLTYWARESDRLRRWLSLRSGAETARHSAFHELATALMDVSLSGALQGLALIREHLLNEQRSYLRARAARHRRSSERTTMLGGFATALTFIGGSGAIITSFVPGQSWISVAGVFGIAAATYAANRDSLYLDKHNSDLCEKTAAGLDQIAACYDAVETEVQLGNRNTILSFTNVIIELLEAEHQQWREGCSQVESFINDIEQRTQRIGSAHNASPAVTLEGEQSSRDRILRSVPLPDS